MTTRIEEIRIAQQERYAIQREKDNLKYPEIRIAIQNYINATPAQLEAAQAIMKARGY